MPKTSKARELDKRHTSHPDRATLALYLDDELSHEDNGQVQDHVSTCSLCRTEFLDMCRLV